MIGISGSLIWSKTLMEIIFNPCAIWCTWDLFRSFKVCSDAKERVGCGKQREATVKLQPWFLSLRWKTCLRQNFRLDSCVCSEGPPLGQNTLLMTVKMLCHDMQMYFSVKKLFQFSVIENGPNFIK